jgi:hypothetical protein
VEPIEVYEIFCFPHFFGQMFRKSLQIDGGHFITFKFTMHSHAFMKLIFTLPITKRHGKVGNTSAVVFGKPQVQIRALLVVFLSPSRQMLA